MRQFIFDALQQSIQTKQRILHDEMLCTQIEHAAQMMCAAFRQKGKVLFCGNGGSAADAQHIAAELSGRFYKDRPPLFAEALHVNTSFLTAVANDYGYDEAFARAIAAMGRPGDVLVGISTSGNSPNVIKAIEKARQQDMYTIGLTGQQGGAMRHLCHHCILVPHHDTPRIQEAHITIGHIWCAWIEKELFG